ncbi:MAG: DUF3108 domain-containing protein [Longimicrobiales bacterium]
MTRFLCAATLAVGLYGVGDVAAQSSGWSAAAVATDSLAAPAPFGPGEHLVYRVKLGWFNVGQGSLTIEGLEEVRGNPTYRAAMSMNGRATFYKLDDKYTTWFDTRQLQSWRFIRDYKGTYTSFRHYEFYPEQDIWDREDNDESGPMATDNPLDDIAFVYFLRTLPLEVGDTYTFDRYFRQEGNPVTVRVLRKDRRETDAGEFNTIVVSPSFQSEGLFAEGGKAELHFTDDERRILVYMKVDMPRVPGSLTLHLQSIQEGFPLNPQSRAEVLSAREARQQGGRSNR